MIKLVYSIVIIEQTQLTDIGKLLSRVDDNYELLLPLPPHPEDQQVMMTSNREVAIDFSLHVTEEVSK